MGDQQPNELIGLEVLVDALDMNGYNFLVILVEAIISNPDGTIVVLQIKDIEPYNAPNQVEAPQPTAPEENASAPPRNFRIFVTKNRRGQGNSQAAPNFVNSTDPNDPYIFRE